MSHKGPSQLATKQEEEHSNLNERAEKESFKKTIKFAIKVASLNMRKYERVWEQQSRPLTK